MNIKKAIEQVKINFRPENHYKFIKMLEALDEPIRTYEYNHPNICECCECKQNRISSRFYNENKQLKTDLAIAKESNETLSDMLATANALVRNLEDKYYHALRLISTYNNKS